VARKVFYSFHFDNDFSRTQVVRNIGALEGNKPVTPNKWEEVKEDGDEAIEKWIEDNIKGKSCVVVLVGAETAGRQWINYELSHGWNEGKGVVAVRIHGLKDLDGETSSAGDNPLKCVSFKNSKKTLASVAKIYNPAGKNSKEVYKSIADNIESWIDEAIQIRNDYTG
jgi:hypothetical protein